SPFLLEQAYLQLDHPRIAQGVADHVVPPTVGHASFDDLDEDVAAFFSQHDASSKLLEMALSIKRSSIQRSDDSHIHDGYAEQLHQVEGQRLRARSGPVVEAESRVQTNPGDRIHRCTVQHAIRVAK